VCPILLGDDGGVARVEEANDVDDELDVLLQDGLIDHWRNSFMGMNPCLSGLADSTVIWATRLLSSQSLT
jgi:hypothetical protein